MFGDFAKNLHEHGLDHISPEVQDFIDSRFEFNVSAGLAEGKLSEDFEATVKLAESRQKTIVRRNVLIIKALS